MSGPDNKTTSENYGFNPAATRVITQAYRKMGVINENETPTAGEFRDGMDALNDLITELQATGIHIWTVEEAILFFQPGQYRYTVGPDQTDHFAPAYEYALTTLATTAAAGAKALSLVAPPLMSYPFAVNQQVGVVLDSGSTFWTTIDTLSSQTSFSLKDALPSPASESGFVFAYMTGIQRPLRIPASRRLQLHGMILTPLTNMMSRKEYQDLPNPQALGQVTQAYYNPARDVGELFVWNAPQNSNAALRFTYYRPLQGFLSPDNTADLPREWSNALLWNLALELSANYAVPSARLNFISVQAARKLELVQGWDRESESIYFGRASDQTHR